MRRTLSALLAALALACVPAHAAQKDAAQRLDQLRQRASGGATPGYGKVKKGQTFYKAPKVALDTSDKLAVKIELGFDGRTPEAAIAFARSKLSSKVLPENERLVTDTLRTSHRAFTFAVNNAYVPGTPIHGFLTGPLAGAEISILGTVSQVNPMVIMAKKPGERLASYYRQEGGQFVKMDKLPYSVVMKARLEDGTKGGLRLTYQTWSNKRLQERLLTITELGSGGQPPR